MNAPAAFCLGLAAGAAGAGAAAWTVMRRREARMGRALSFAAHELNTPLTAVHMTIINFLAGIFGDVPPGHLKWLEMLRSQSFRLGGVVAEMRDFIHFAIRGDIMVRTEEVSISETLESVVQNVGSSISESASKLLVDAPSGLPAVNADPERLGRLLTSLLFHARKFKTSGDVSLKASAAGAFVFIEIRYSGRPLPPGEAERSMDLFYTAHRGKDEVLSAVGMGLGLTRAIIRLQGGDLELAVDPEGKARLTLTLARQAAAGAFEPAEK